MFANQISQAGTIWGAQVTMVAKINLPQEAGQVQPMGFQPMNPASLWRGPAQFSLGYVCRWGYACLEPSIDCFQFQPNSHFYFLCCVFPSNTQSAVLL